MFDIFNMLKKDEAKAVKQVTRETIIGDILEKTGMSSLRVSV